MCLYFLWRKCTGHGSEQDDEDPRDEPNVKPVVSNTSPSAPGAKDAEGQQNRPMMTYEQQPGP